MIDLVIDRRIPTWISHGANASVVAASMVRQVQDFETFGVPGVKLLSHVLVVDLVDNDIKLVYLGEDTHL